MVTHSWSNHFAHLVASVVADALELPSYESVLARLEAQEMLALNSELYWKKKLVARQNLIKCGAIHMGTIWNPHIFTYFHGMGCSFTVQDVSIRLQQLPGYRVLDLLFQHQSTCRDLRLRASGFARPCDASAAKSMFV